MCVVRPVKAAGAKPWEQDRGGRRAGSTKTLLAVRRDDASVIRARRAKDPARQEPDASHRWLIVYAMPPPFRGNPNVNRSKGGYRMTATLPADQNDSAISKIRSSDQRLAETVDQRAAPQGDDSGLSQATEKIRKRNPRPPMRRA